MEYEDAETMYLELVDIIFQFYFIPYMIHVLLMCSKCSRHSKKKKKK